MAKRKRPRTVTKKSYQTRVPFAPARQAQNGMDCSNAIYIAVSDGGPADPCAVASDFESTTPETVRAFFETELLEGNAVARYVLDPKFKLVRR
jgi:hypothetical protein